MQPKQIKTKKRLEKAIFEGKIMKWKEKIFLRDKLKCQKCGKDLTNQPKHVHHIVSLQNVKRKYPELLEDEDNGILLCAYCHKFAPDSAHQGGFEFTLWFMKTKPAQYVFLGDKISHNESIKKISRFLGDLKSVEVEKDDGTTR